MYIYRNREIESENAWFFSIMKGKPMKLHNDDNKNKFTDVYTLAHILMPRSPAQHESLVCCLS